MLQQVGPIIYAAAFLCEAAAFCCAVRMIVAYQRKGTWSLIALAVASLAGRTLTGYHMAHMATTVRDGAFDLIAAILVLIAVLTINPMFRAMKEQSEKLCAEKLELELSVAKLDGKLDEANSEIGQVTENLSTERDRFMAIITTESSVLNDGLDFAGVKSLIVSRAQEIVKASGVTIEMIDGGNTIFDTVSGCYEPQLGVRISMEKSFAGLAIRAGYFKRCDDAEKDERTEAQECKRLGVRSLISVPIQFGQKTVGALTAVSPQSNAFGDGAMRVMHLMVLIVSEAMRRSSEAEAARISQQKADEATKTLQECEPLLEASFDHSLLGAAVIEPNGTIVKVNAALCEMLGYDEKHLLSMKREMLLDKDDVSTQRECKVIVTQGADSTKVSNIRYQCADGRTLFVIQSDTLVSDLEGKPLYYFTQVQDVTQSIKILAELDDVKAELASREAAEPSPSAVDAPPSSADHGKLLAHLGRAVRRPIDGIVGIANLTLDTSLTAEQRENLRLVKLTAGSLLNMTEDLNCLALSEANELTLDLSPFVVCDTIHEALSELAITAHAKGLEIAIDIDKKVPESVIGDSHNFSHIVTNLVANAIKFTTAGEVVVRVTADYAKDGTIMLELAVRDTGLGISLGRQATLFDENLGSEGTQQQSDGAGLGLIVTHRLADLMEGRIWVESKLGSGSTFHVTVQAKINECAVVPIAVRRANVPVLIVDDNSTHRRILRDMIGNWDMRPVLAENGIVAWKLMQDALDAGRPFPLVLLDGTMPEIDGFELAAWIKKDAALSKSAVILMSSGDLHEDALKCFSIGAEAFLSKPIKQSELFRTIINVLDETSSTDGHPDEQPDPVRKVRHTILLAEGNIVDQRIATCLLEKQGHHVTIARNGLDAFDRIAETNFDIVFMDMDLPSSDGLETTKRVRNRERSLGGHVAIFGMSRDHAHQERCLSGGMDGYVAKPLDVRYLLEAIDALSTLAYATPDPQLAVANFKGGVAVPKAPRSTKTPRSVAKPVENAKAFEKPQTQISASVAKIEETAPLNIKEIVPVAVEGGVNTQDLPTSPIVPDEFVPPAEMATVQETTKEVEAEIPVFEPTAEVTIFNLEEALTQVDGDRKRLGEMVAIFMKATPILVSKIRELLELEDPAGAALVATQLKVSALDLGAIALSEAVQVLEDAAISENPMAIRFGLACVDANISFLTDKFNKVQIYDQGIS